jgi:hypothetical protein
VLIIKREVICIAKTGVVLKKTFGSEGLFNIIAALRPIVD